MTPRSVSIPYREPSRLPPGNMMGHHLKRLHEGDGDDHTPAPRTPNKIAMKRQRTETKLLSAPLPAPSFSSPLTLIPTAVTTTTPRRLQGISAMKPKPPAKLTPSAIMGLSTVASQLPIRDCRNILSNVLSDREVRMLMTHLVTSGKPPRRKTATYLSARFDELNTPKPDQIVAFDEIVTAVQSAFRPLSLDATSPAELEAVMTAHGVQSNVRYIHAASVWPASLGTRLNALRAILEITQHLIRSSLLREMRHQQVFEKECPTLSTAVLHICQGLTAPERVVALGMHFPRYSPPHGVSHRAGQSMTGGPAVGGQHGSSQGNGHLGSNQHTHSQGGSATSRAVEDTVEVELRAQAEFFRKQNMFPEFMEAYQMLVGSKRATGTAVQAVPIGVGVIEEESEEDDEEEEREEEDEEMDVVGEAEIPDTQETG